MRSTIAALIIIPSFLVAAPVSAQSNPSVDQIIKSLTPMGDVSRSATRGIRLSPNTGTPAEVRSSALPITQASVKATKSPDSDTSIAQPQHAAAPSVNLTVNFALGSAELTPQAIKTLDDLGKALSSDTLANFRFRVEGHTDTVGTREFNRSLSERRAAVVVEYIVEKYKVPAGRLEPAGLGADHPLVQTADQVAEARNRRVQVVNLGT
jgi:outer membrane protein OmpA-like peptidoglycan-associated protein